MVSTSLIPFVALLVSAAFGAISVAWKSGRRETAPLTAIFACTGFWALTNLLASIESDPATAARFLVFAHVPALLLGPATLALLEVISPDPAGRRRRAVRVTAAIAVCLGLVAAVLPGSLHGVRATAWGWMPRFGWPSLVIMPVGMIVPLAGAVLASRVRTRPRVTRRQARSARGVVFCVVLSLSAGISTEYLLPLLEIPAPRVGALSVALASALMWLRILHASDDLVVTPHGLARAMLSELHDGVVLVDPAGRIQGCNLRFAEMLGQDRFDLVGVDLASVADLPPALLHGRLEERELVIRTPGQAAMPVSISSSPVCDRRGERVGMVVVFRDRLAVDALRRRLLASGRLAAVGELAAGIAHEVNNPIAFIRSDLNLLASHLQTLHDTLAKRDGIEPELRVFDGAALRIESSLESLDRVTEVVADVRAFAHLGGRTQQGGEASTLVESALRLARLLRGDAVTIELSGEARSARVEAAQDLKQVLFALLRVLVGESATGGRVDVGLEPGAGWLHVTLRADRLEAPAAALLARFPELDSGLGSADPGLAIAIELIERVGGRCRARADGADGLAIELALPLAEDASA